jgi:hypothetical protein
MMKPIPDNAEVVLEFPDRFDIGTFERSSRFEAHLDETGIALTLCRGDVDSDRKSARVHIHYALFAEILRDLAKSVAAIALDDVSHRDALAQAARVLDAALRHGEQSPGPIEQIDDSAEMSAEEEVALLHILE